MATILPAPFSRRATPAVPGLVTLGEVARRTTGPLNLFVSPTGNDANDGLSVGTPKLTPQAVFDLVPQFVDHEVTVNFAAGTYDVGVTSAKLSSRVIGATGVIALLGTTGAPTLSGGTTSGTVTAFASALSTGALAVLTDSAQSWVVNELRGRFVLLGTTFHPVVSNTATTISLTQSANPSVGAAYSIVEPKAILTGSASAANTETLLLQGLQGASNGTLGNVRVRQLRVEATATTGSASALRMRNVADISIADACQVVRTGSATGASINAQSVGRMVLGGGLYSESTGQALQALQLTGDCSLSSCYFRSSSSTGVAVFVRAASLVSVGSLACERSVVPGTSNSSLLGVAGRVLAQTGVWLAQPVSASFGTSMSLGDGATVLGVTSGSFVIDGPLHISGFATGMLVDGAQLVGVRGPWTILNCTTAADLRAGAQLRFPGVTPTVTGVTNELLLDGVPSTFAAVEAASPKQVSNVLGTRAMKV